MLSAGFRFPKAGRLRKRPELVAVQRDGKARHSRYFVVVSDASGCGRLGITVSKKVGNAVNRNRVKRLVREFVRNARLPDLQWQHPWLPADMDVVVIAKPSARSESTRTLWDDLRTHAVHLANESRAGAQGLP